MGGRSFARATQSLRRACYGNVLEIGGGLYDVVRWLAEIVDVDAISAVLRCLQDSQRETRLIVTCVANPSWL